MLPFERTLLRHLCDNAEFAERVMPYLKEEYFMSDDAAVVFRVFQAFFTKYQKVPQFAALTIGIDNWPKLTERETKGGHAAIDMIKAETPLTSSQDQWILETTETWVKDRALYCAIHQSIKIVDDPKETTGSIPKLLQDALSVCFDSHIGHDYYADSLARFEFYHQPQNRIPFNLDVLNKMTGGGVPKKTLNVVLAGTNVGKSLALCDFAASYVDSGKNVLYVTCEMAEEWIAQRVDANLFNIPMDDVVLLSQNDYVRKMASLRQRSTGRLIVKEYPNGYAHVGVLRTLLNDLALKQNFVPDVIMVDYLTIMACEEMKPGAVNSFTYFKKVAEELRALGVQFKVPIWTAAQFNREGFKSTDPGLEHVGESFGIVQTSDFCIALVSSDELEKLGQIAMYELKNRYGKRRSYDQHLLGIDTPRMKLYELSAAQVAQSLTLPTNSPAGQNTNPSVGAFSNRTRRSKPFGSLVAESEKVSTDTDE